MRSNVTARTLEETALTIDRDVLALLAARHRQHMHRRDLVTISHGARRVHRHDVQLTWAHDHHEPLDIIAPPR
jgi:hypothetical protein